MNYPYAKDVGVSTPTNCPLFLIGLTSGQVANAIVPIVDNKYITKTKTHKLFYIFIHLLT